MPKQHALAAALTFALFAACDAGEETAADAGLATVTQELTRDRYLLPRAAESTWWYSSVGGDRGTAWRSDPYEQYALGWQPQDAPMGYGEAYVHPIPYGSDAAHKPATAYFRGWFYVDVTQLQGLRLEMMFDDGFVVYVNGVEVKRVNMPSGAVTYTTLATNGEANNRYVSYDLDAAIPLLHDDATNLIAIEVHQTSPSSSDLVFDAAFVGELEDYPLNPWHGSIPRKNWWGYWDGGGDLGTAWRAQGYDDHDWLTARGPLGYGESYVTTPVSYGASASNKHLTTYFRREFIVDDPTAIAGMLGELMYDDGVVVYLNGVEIQRATMPAGVITSTTLAGGHEAGNVYQGYDWGAWKSLLVAGVNTIAAEVHQQDRTSSDLVFDLSLTLQLGPPPAPLPGSIDRRASWAYWDRGGDLGTTWRAGSFNDSWAGGAGPLGYGESYVATTVSYGPSASNKHRTTYFRKQFTVTKPADFAVTSLVAEVMYDDGVVIYLNGQEATRLAMPAGAITAQTLSLGHETGNAYETYDLVAGRDLIVDGVNTIAVEVHQQAATSSDLVFDLSLRAELAPRFTKHPDNPGIRPTGEPYGDPTWYMATVNSPAVVQLGPSSYVLYFTGNDDLGPHYSIGRAVSTDGVHWTVDEDAYGIGRLAGVVYDGSTYFMYQDDFWDEVIYVATSTDGTGWTHRGQAFGDQAGLALLRDSGGFRAWHTDVALGPSYSTSTDGITWVRQAAVVGPMPRGTVLRNGAGFEGWFADAGGCRYTSSPDGLTWTKGGASLTVGDPGAWDQGFSACSGAVRDGALRKLWYASSATNSGGIGYASSP